MRTENSKTIENLNLSDSTCTYLLDGEGVAVAGEYFTELGLVHLLHKLIEISLRTQEGL